VADVWTYHNDNARTGQNLDETELTPATVNKDGFGKLFTLKVKGQVYAQPLYLSGVAVDGKGTHNVIFVATENNSVYAFDADSATGPNANPLWHVSFIDEAMGLTPVPFQDTRTGDNRGDINPWVGITGTPVIDVKTGTLYVVAKTKQVIGRDNHYVQLLHALDVGSGAEKFGGPAVIAETIWDFGQPAQYVSGPKVPGSGESNDGHGQVFFDALRQNQRSGLALVNGVVYVAWASHNDLPPFHGWVAGYDAGTLKLVGVFNTTPNAKSDPGAEKPPGRGLAGGGVWQSGGAPAADEQGALYFATGNGKFDPADDARNFGNSVLKLSTDGGRLALADFFTPSDWKKRNDHDVDLGSGGALLLPDQPAPHPHLLVYAGKGSTEITGQGKGGSTIYLLDRDNLGKFHEGDDSQIVQSLPGAIGDPGASGGDNGAFCTPAYFNNRVYYLGTKDFPKAYEVRDGKLSATPVSQANQKFPVPGATPSVSANGSSNGIVWVSRTDKFDFSKKPAVLHAYDADDLANELYNSNQAGPRDQPGVGVKFAVPTVANGKVYVGTTGKDGTTGEVTVYGLLGH
jgi:hypothetical protein